MSKPNPKTLQNRYTEILSQVSNSMKCQKTELEYIIKELDQLISDIRELDQSPHKDYSKSLANLKIVRTRISNMFVRADKIERSFNKCAKDMRTGK